MYWHVLYSTRQSNSLRSNSGVPGGTRTPDFNVRNVALYPLSYGHTVNLCYS